MTDPDADPITTSTELREGINALRDQTRHADSKAQMLAGALIPSLVGAVAVGGFAGLPPAAIALGIPATGFALAATIALGIVIWPQGSLIVTDTPSGALDRARHRAAASDHGLVVLSTEQFDLESIVAAKWRWLRRAITCAAAALSLGAVTVAIAALA